MKLNHSIKDINEFNFKHHGCKITYGSECMPSEGDTLHIEFNDLSEVDELIHILENFKKTCLSSWEYFTNTTYKE